MQEGINMETTKIFMKRARDSYIAQLRRIPVKVAAIEQSRAIRDAWGENDGREARVDFASARDVSFPIYVYLTLGKHDDICKEGMLFLEDMEERFLLDFNSVPGVGTSTDNTLGYYRSGEVLVIFVAGADGTCRIIEKTETILEKRVKVISREILCD